MYFLLFMHVALVAQTVYILVLDAISCNTGGYWRGPESSAALPSVERKVSCNVCVQCSVMGTLLLAQVCKQCTSILRVDTKKGQIISAVLAL